MPRKTVSKAKVPDKPTGRYKHLDTAFKLIDQWKQGDRLAVATELSEAPAKVVVAFVDLLFSLGLRQDLKQLNQLLTDVEVIKNA